MPKQLVLEFPVEFPEEELEDVDLINQGKEAIVLGLFQKGRVSSGYAADLLGLSLVDFMELLKRKAIPFAHYTNKDLKKDVEGLKQYEKDKSSRRK